MEMIAIVTVTTPEIEEYSKYTLEIFKKYCSMHNYDLIIGDHNTDRHPSWNKVLLLKKYYKKYDYLFWFDVDIIIQQLDYKLENITKLLQRPFGICKDYRHSFLNCGSIVVSNDRRIEPRFFDHWWELGKQWLITSCI